MDWLAASCRGTLRDVSRGGLYVVAGGNCPPNVGLAPDVTQNTVWRTQGPINRYETEHSPLRPSKIPQNVFPVMASPPTLPVGITTTRRPLVGSGKTPLFMFHPNLRGLSDHVPIFLTFCGGNHDGEHWRGNFIEMILITFVSHCVLNVIVVVQPAQCRRPSQTPLWTRRVEHLERTVPGWRSAVSADTSSRIWWE